jgi:uncharacterized membrane protein
MEELRSLLSRATDAEKMSLARILGAESKIDELILALQRAASSTLDYHILGKRPSYKEILDQIAGQRKIKSAALSTEGVELSIVKLHFKDFWDRMTPDQRSKFERQLQRERLIDGRSARIAGATLTGAGLLAAQASGFGVYLLASSTLAALTSGLGLALPFAAYTAMSSAISLAIGPAGWIGLSLLVLYNLTGPDAQKTASAIAMICSIRGRLKAERQARLRQRHVMIFSAIACVALIALVVWHLR